MMKHLHPTIDRLIDSAHGELSPPQETAVRAHLAECPPCTAAFEDEVRLGALLREHARAEERERYA